ncbi:MAG: hypothetical protein OXU28_01010 [Chloroflexota bacterium]|nr:hypothetical protein [Rhodospirillaceae bacterium]MDE0360783.1 hypothetical protein [Rhodospirillaceae bacterium]MDE2958619.1 hypothetical protein [Chloroflexota bacterium]
MKKDRSMALFAVLLSALLAGCAGQQEVSGDAALQANDAEAPDAETLQEIRLNAEQVALQRPPQDSDVVCERIAPTGSHIPQRRCVTRAALREETEQAQEWLRSDGTRGGITEVR